MSAAISLNQNSTEQANFEREIMLLEAQLDNAGFHSAYDSIVRLQYSKEVSKAAAELYSLADGGKMSWQQAAKEANELRNTVIDILRARSTPVGRAYAEAKKKVYPTLGDMIKKKTTELFGERAQFRNLNQIQQGLVYKKVLTSAGKSSPRVNKRMRQVAGIGKGLVIVSLAISVYQIAESENRLRTAGEEAASASASFAGGLAAGWLAGWGCGPGAPICVTIGAFVGGTLAAFGMHLGMEIIWD